MSKVMVVTGGSRGIGAATARLAADRGYAVCVNYLKNQTAANTVVDDIKAKGGQAIAVAADVALEADVIKLFKAVDTQLGTITALVNNAGILETQMRVEQMDADRLSRIFAANITGCFLCAREAVKTYVNKPRWQRRCYCQCLVCGIPAGFGWRICRLCCFQGCG